MSVINFSDIVELKSIDLLDKLSGTIFRHIEFNQPYRVRSVREHSTLGKRFSLRSKSSLYSSPTADMLRLSRHVIAIGDTVLFKPARFEPMMKGLVKCYDHDSRLYVVVCGDDIYYCPARLLTLIQES